MPKYYIKSGDIKFIIDTTDPTSAILTTLYKYKNTGVIAGPKICISETGFEDHKKWICHNTYEYLKRI